MTGGRSCDFPFARDGIAAMTLPHMEIIVFADPQRDHLTTSRQTGTLQNLKDRRFDLYQIQWHSTE